MTSCISFLTKFGPNLSLFHHILLFYLLNINGLVKKQYSFYFRCKTLLSLWWTPRPKHCLKPKYLVFTMYALKRFVSMKNKTKNKYLIFCSSDKHSNISILFPSVSPAVTGSCTTGQQRDTLSSTNTARRRSEQWGGDWRVRGWRQQQQSEQVCRWSTLALNKKQHTNKQSEKQNKKHIWAAVSHQKTTVRRSIEQPKHPSRLSPFSYIIHPFIPI